MLRNNIQYGRHKNPCLLIMSTMQSSIVDLCNFHKTCQAFRKLFLKGFIFNSGGRRRPLCWDPTPGVFNCYVMILTTPVMVCRQEDVFAKRCFDASSLTCGCGVG